MYDKTWWNKLSKQQQIVVTSTSIRGAIIDSFVHIETVMADIVIIVDYNGDYKEYYKGFRATRVIVSDFLKCYEKIKIHADKYFTDKESLKEDIEYLADIRNRAAHFLCLNDDEILKESDPFQTIYFYSIRYSQDDCCSLTGALVRNYQNKIQEFLVRFAKLQKDIYSTAENLPKPKTTKEFVDSCKHIVLKEKFNSLK